MYLTSWIRMPRVTIASLLSVTTHPERPEAFYASLINQSVGVQQRKAAACDGCGWVGQATVCITFSVVTMGFLPTNWEAGPPG